MRDATVAELYREHFLAVKRFLARTLRSEETAAEIAQDAFVKLLRYESDKPIENPRAFLFRIALNAARDHMAKTRTRSRYTAEDGDVEAVQATDPDPEETVHDRERLRILSEAVDDLPPKCREVFLLSRVQGLTNPEIAEELGISRNMVEKHIIKAMMRCRQALERSKN